MSLANIYITQHDCVGVAGWTQTGDTIVVTLVRQGATDARTTIGVDYQIKGCPRVSRNAGILGQIRCST